MVKFLIVTATYKRQESFKRFLDNFVFLRLTSKVDLDLLIVGDEENYEIAKEYDPAIYAIQPNKPLGMKWNAAVKMSKDLEWDYIFISGSDDLYSPALLDHYLELTKDGYHYLGLLDFYFLETKTGLLKYFPGFTRDRRGEPLGAGRLLHRNVLEALDYHLWDDVINYGLDASMTKSLKSLEIKSKFITLQKNGLVAMDLKDGHNIHDFKKWGGTIVRDQREDILNAVGWNN